jgi:tetratricopeptide (TPR) repeat protein
LLARAAARLELAIAASLWGLLAVGVAGAQAPSEARALARAQDAEHKLLQRVQTDVARGQSERALRALVRALAHAPSGVLLERYAQLALPMRLPASERERSKFGQAADRLLGWLQAGAAQTDASLPLVLHAAWALALRSEFEASRQLVARHGAADSSAAARCLRLVATWALKQRALSEAEETLNLARGFAPADPELAGELGLVLLARGEAQRALGPLGERFAADPSQLTPRRDFAYALRATGRAGEAFTLLAAAGDACAVAERCPLELARSALEAGELNAAVNHAELAARQPAAQLDALFIAAEAHGRQGDREAARRAYQRILQTAPNNLRARSALRALETPAADPPASR